MECNLCNGTGMEICTNPDHDFIAAIGHEIGRLGCPGCGHSEKFTIPNTVCEQCKGKGII